MQHSQNLPLSLRIYPHPSPHFQQLYYYATLPESISPSHSIPAFQQLYATLPETPPPSENTPICMTTILNPPLSEYIHPPLSRTICDIPRIYSSVTEYSPFSRTTCICQRRYLSLPGRVAHTNLLYSRGGGGGGYNLEGSHIIIVVEKEGEGTNVMYLSSYMLKWLYLIPHSCIIVFLNTLNI